MECTEKVFQFSHFLSTFHFLVTLHQLKDCNCCSVSEVREMPVELVCEDNYRLIKHFNIPSSCSCTKCDGEKGKLLKLTATSWWKIFSGNHINKLQIDKTQLPEWTDVELVKPKCSKLNVDVAKSSRRDMDENKKYVQHRGLIKTWEKNMKISNSNIEREIKKNRSSEKLIRISAPPQLRHCSYKKNNIQS